MGNRVKIAHIISNLAAGGAETMLYKLVCAMDSRRFENEVFSLTSLGEIGRRLQAKGVRVLAISMRKSFPSPVSFIRLVRLLRQSQPALVQTWMYHADLLGGVAARYAGRLPVVWGIHHNNVDPKMNKRRTLGVVWTCAHLSNVVPERIICCSTAAIRLHSALGYAQNRLEFIPNGFDVDEFHPDLSSRLSVRRELGLPPDEMVIGLTSRYHPLKNIPSFISAASKLKSSFPSVQFVLCGNGLTSDNAELVSALKRAGIYRQVHLLGIRHDMPRLYASFDIATSCSVSEAFPLAVGEAMACGIPCVVTDAGDSALLVGEAGRVVPTRDPGALAAAWAELVSSASERRRFGILARRRIEDSFNLFSVAQRYQDLYERILYHKAFRFASPTFPSSASNAEKQIGVPH